MSFAHDGSPVDATLSQLPMFSPREVSRPIIGHGVSSEALEAGAVAVHSLRRRHSNLLLQGTLMFSVIALGCADVILRQIVAKTLTRFSYMIGLATAAAYLPVYWLILLTLIRLDVVPKSQMLWAWAGWRHLVGSFTKGVFSPPYVKLFLYAALGDALGNGLGYICTPYVSGPVHSLLSQFTIMFTAMLSMCCLHKRYSLAQVIGLLGVEIAVLIGVMPSLGNGENSSDPFFSFLLAFSCSFNAFAWVLKEMSFKLYKSSVNDIDDANCELLATACDGARPERDSLHIFIVNSHVALFQLPLALLLVPLAQATGQTRGEDVLSYLREGFGCLAGSTKESPLCPEAARFTMQYVVVNIVWNWIIYLNVKFNGALATFVALKAISPCSAVLFAYVDWPLLHTTTVKPLTWVVLIVIMPFIVFYVWASRQQQRREEESPPTATCLWPLGMEQGPPGDETDPTRAIT